MRFPNTYSARAMFIVITTVLFHFIFYLVAPSIYLKFSDKSGPIMTLISNQAINFMIVQIIMAGFDLMFCCWNRNLRLPFKKFGHMYLTIFIIYYAKPYFSCFKILVVYLAILVVYLAKPLT